MNPFQSLADYERFVYSLLQQFPFIRRSTLVVIRYGASIAVVRGEVELPEGIRMVIRDELSFEKLPGRIRGYGYEVWKGGEQLYWYDSQPHPNNPSLAATHPHHKHIHPNIKRKGGVIGYAAKGRVLRKFAGRGSRCATAKGESGMV